VAIVVVESIESPSVGTGDSASAERRYIITGAASESAAIDALLAEAPGTHDIHGDGRKILTLESVNVQSISDDQWGGAVRYTSRATQTQESDEGGGDDPEPDALPNYSFEISAKTRRITRSIKTIRRILPDDAPQGMVATDYGGLINNGEGVDFPTDGDSTFTESYTFPREFVTYAYYKKISAMVGKVNEQRFRGFNAGDVLLMRVSGNYQPGNDKWSLQFEFHVSLAASKADRTHIEIMGPTIKRPVNETPASDILLSLEFTDRGAGIEKEGWQYLWSSVLRYVDKLTGAEILAPIQVNIEQIAEYTDFSRLWVSNI